MMQQSRIGIISIKTRLKINEKSEMPKGTVQISEEDL